MCPAVSVSSLVDNQVVARKHDTGFSGARQRVVFGTLQPADEITHRATRCAGSGCGIKWSKMKAALKYTAAAGLGLDLDQFVVTSQGQRRHRDRMLSGFRDTWPASRGCKRFSALRRTGRCNHHSECSCKPHGTVDELGAGRRVTLGGKFDSVLVVARKDGTTRHERTLEAALWQLCVALIAVSQNFERW